MVNERKRERHRRKEPVMIWREFGNGALQKQNGQRDTKKIYQCTGKTQRGRDVSKQKTIKREANLQADIHV